ncbi:MAG: diguanylate cyclase domain-containing protein, partial [Mycobacterium sp.]
RFKTINDTLGHGVGDTVLWTVAERISECVRHGDTVGRTGGDEMLVLLPGLHSLEEAIQIAEKIQARTAAPIEIAGSTFHATLSIGATLAVPGETVVDVTARADAAMYQSKHAGGNTVRGI